MTWQNSRGSRKSGDVPLNSLSLICRQQAAFETLKQFYQKLNFFFCPFSGNESETERILRTFQFIVSIHMHVVSGKPRLPNKCHKIRI